MNNKVLQILESLNVPHNNSSVSVDAYDIEEAFNLDKELTIKEFDASESLLSVGDEIAKAVAENNFSKVVMFVVVADLSLSDIEQFTSLVRVQDVLTLLGTYQPNEGENNRVVAIMQ